MRISVDAIRVVRFPNRKSNGQTWDTFGTGHPDLYLRLYEERTNDKLVNIDYYMEDITTSVTFNEPVTFDYPNENHVLELLDYDGILNPNIIATLRFKPHQVGTDFPNTIKLVSTNVEIELIGAKYNF